MSTDPNRVKAIFLAAAELPDVAARTAYLEQVCGGDTGLRERVEALLCSHDPSGSFLGTPAAALPDPDNAGTMALGPPGTSGSPASRDHGDESESLQFLTPSARPDSLGRLGHYEVLQVLGKGGFGIVFRAFDDVLQRVVAIKMLAPQMAATSPARKRFLREARTSAAVRHENVVQVYEVGEQPLPYLVMEFIPGETLQQRLDRVGPLDVLEVLRIGRQIAEGLAAAHANDLIHRDIKPGNVLLEGGQHRVRITDFGLARAADDASMTQSGMIAGTPMYMAPEQALGQTLDQRADLFSLGSVLYQMVAGRPPFRANTTVAVLKRVAEDTPRSIREVIPETPQWLCDIISKLHAKNPADRYQSAREVADVLADCEAQLKTNSKLRDYSRIPRQTPQRSGNRRWVATAAVVLLPIVALALMEFTGVTRLMRPQASREPNRPEIAPTHGVATKTLDQSGWVQLFNGKDLTGFAASSANWSVENGLLVGKDTSHLLARGVYKNFHARVKAKYNAGCRGLFLIGESDVYVRIGNQTNQSTGALLHYKPNTPAISGYGKQLVPPDTWFDLEVIVQGKRIIAKVNGIITADKIVDAMPRATRPFSLDTAVAGSLLHVEKFEIKELPPEEPGWVQLFNGKDLTGWKSIPNPNNNTGWTWADDVLTFKGLGDLLVTDRTDYGNFHLRLSIKCKSDSGAAIRLRDAGGLNGDRYLTGIGAGTAPNTITGGGLTVFQNKERKRTELAKNADVGPVDQWHTFEVIAVGNRFQTLVNGKPIADVTDPDQTRMRGSIALSLLRRNPQEVHFRNVEIKELPPTPPAASAFVILARDKRAQTQYATLTDAVQAAQSGDTIEIRGNGPFLTEPITIDAKALTIRAAAGFHPVINGNQGFRELISTNALLVLEGMEFHQIGAEGAQFLQTVQSVVGCSGADLHVANCRFLQGPKLMGEGRTEYGRFISGHGRQWHIRNCEFRGSGMQGDVYWTCNSGGRLVVENCLFLREWQGVNVIYDDPASQDVLVRLAHNTFATPSTSLQFTLKLSPEAVNEGPGERPVRVDAAENVFAVPRETFTHPFVFQQQEVNGAKPAFDADADALLRRLVEWRGERNLYPKLAIEGAVRTQNIDGLLGMRLDSTGCTTSRAYDHLNDWNQFWGAEETGSQMAKAQYLCGGLEGRYTSCNLPERVITGEVRLHPDSPGKGAGKGGKDLGADVDLVGPGAAYEKWKLTKEYEEWRKLTEALMVSGATPRARPSE